MGDDTRKARAELDQVTMAWAEKCDEIKQLESRVLSKKNQSNPELVQLLLKKYRERDDLNNKRKEVILR
jgi:hypothetical protein